MDKKNNNFPFRQIFDTLQNTLDRWIKAVQLMYKKTVIPTLDKIKIIKIYKADYNFILCMIWGQRLVWNAQKYNAYMPA